MHQVRIRLQTALELLLVESASSKLPNLGVRPRSVRISWSCPVILSTARSTRARRAKSIPASASRCTSASGSPQARRCVTRWWRVKLA